MQTYYPPPRPQGILADVMSKNRAHRQNCRHTRKENNTNKHHKSKQTAESKGQNFQILNVSDRP